MILRHIIPAILIASLPLAGAAPIDLKQPIIESLTPDILYFNFDQEFVEDVSDLGPRGFEVTVSEGLVGELPRSVESRTPEFGKAMEFHYGALEPSATDMNPNDYHRGNHLIIPSDPVLNLVDTSFTMGGWVKVPDVTSDLTMKWKHILSKGGYRDTFPGWGLYIDFRGNQSRWFLNLNLAGEFDDDYVLVSAPLDDLDPDRWCHVAATYNHETEEVVLYENGIPIHTATVAVKIAPSEYDLTIGERGISTQNNLPAVMDEVFITSGVHEFMPAD